MKLTKPWSRFVGDVVLGAVGLALGAAAFMLFQATVGGAATDQAAEPVVEVNAPPATGSGATSPEAAIRQFLNAESAALPDEAFELLSRADRQNYSSAQLWAARSPLGEVQSWHWNDLDRPETTIAVEPGLSLTRGWTPASTVIVWSVVNEDGWRVSLSDSIAEAAVPDPATADAAAADWLNNPTRCDELNDPRLSLATPSPSFAQACADGGSIVSDVSAPASGRVAAELSLAYGPAAAAWARVIPIDSGAELTLIPIGQHWFVVDAVGP